MLQINLKEICRVRGIEKPYSFFIKNGFSEKTAHLLSIDHVKNLKLAHIDKLCTILYCEPSDLFIFQPNEGMHYREDHPLLKIGIGTAPERIDKRLSGTPLKQLIEITKNFNEDDIS